MNRKETKMNATKVLEFKDSSISIDEMISMAEEINTPRAIGIVSIIRYMASLGKSPKEIIKALQILNNIKIK